jgi:hypothetical protein
MTDIGTPMGMVIAALVLVWGLTSWLDYQDRKAQEAEEEKDEQADRDMDDEDWS